jgi:imidazolonepropionase-like amidohydrolase
MDGGQRWMAAVERGERQNKYLDTRLTNSTMLKYLCVSIAVDEGRMCSRLRPMCALLAAGVLLRSAAASTEVPGAPQERPIAIVNATVHPVGSPTIEGGTLLFDQGRIVAVGPEIDIPDDAEQIDGQGQHVYPGLFSAGGQLGLVEINSIRATIDTSETGELNPNARAQVAANPDSELIPVTRVNGVLLCLSIPDGSLVSGSSAVLQLDGWTWEDMTLKASAGMHIRWPRMRAARQWPERRSGREQAEQHAEQLQQLEEFFGRAEQYRRGRTDDSIDVRYEAMLPVLDGSLPVIAAADSQQQIESAVAFAARWKLRLIIYGGYDAEACAPLLRQHGVPVIIPAVYRLPLRRSDPFDAAYTLPHRLHQAGVPFCIAGVDQFAASNLRNLPYHAATAVAYGLDRDAAIRAITLSPAEILGVADRVGSLEPGKDATLIVATGDPLETETQVLHAFIEGRRVQLTNRHLRLWQKYQEKYRRLERADDAAAADTSG